MDGQGFAAAARRLKPVGGFFLIGLAVLTVSRVALALWQQEGISEVDGWWQVFLQGARVDVASLCLLLVPAALLVLALPARAASTRAMRWLIAGWLSACITLLVVLELATPGCMQEYGLRPNRTFVE